MTWSGYAVTAASSGMQQVQLAVSLRGCNTLNSAELDFAAAKHLCVTTMGGGFGDENIHILCVYMPLAPPPPPSVSTQPKQLLLVSQPVNAGALKSLR